MICWEATKKRRQFVVVCIAIVDEHFPNVVIEDVRMVQIC